jgi:hypothetical protein
MYRKYIIAGSTTAELQLPQLPRTMNVVSHANQAFRVAAQSVIRTDTAAGA